MSNEFGVFRDWRVAAERRHYANAVDLFIWRPAAAADTVSVVVDIVTQTQSAGASHGESCLSLSYEAALELMNELWRCGLRPVDAVAGDATLAAKDRHIADLQRIVFGGGG